jgi:NAD(P)-dependent dehydrogenase (short-subunit alcohol dehydrogenase family)
MSGVLDGRTALLLGGAGDIGTAIATRFRAEGARVVVADRKEPRDGASDYIEVDALAYDEVGRHVAEATALNGRLDVFVYLVGWIKLRRALEVPPHEFAQTVDVNLTAQFVWAQAAAKEMARTEGGSVILMGSILGYGGTPGRVAYNASRGGCIQLVRALAVEWAPFSIRVNGLAPSWIDTAALQATGLDTAPLARRSPFGRLGTAEDIAGPALFLASDDSAWVSGVMLPVDGAVTAFLGAGDPTDWELT